MWGYILIILLVVLVCLILRMTWNLQVWKSPLIAPSCLAKAGLKLSVLLPQPPECWCYRHKLPHPATALEFLHYILFSFKIVLSFLAQSKLHKRQGCPETHRSSMIIRSNVKTYVLYAICNKVIFSKYSLLIWMSFWLCMSLYNIEV